VLWVYPEISTVTFKGLDSLTEYTFATRKTYHGFCKVCGVTIRELDDGLGLNVRTMAGLDLGTLEVEKADGWADEPAYEG
jgi:hypothetical protein